MNDLSRKIVVITGASAGVGRATAVEFAKFGATVVMLARNKESLEGAKKEVEDAGGKGFYYQLDVSNWELFEEIAKDIEQKIGPIDIWINNAMTSVFARVQDILPLEFKRVTDVTYLGQVYGTMAALKMMKPRNRGKIVLVGSALAYRGIPLQSAYCGAKHAIQGFFDSLRCELLHDKSGIQLSMVELPALNTTQFGWVKNKLPNKTRPMGKIFQPEVAARSIRYAATHNVREIYVAMPTFKSIIGDKFFPGLLDRILAKSGFKGQQMDELEKSRRPDNLWEPVPGDHGSHGIFNDQASFKSPLLWAVIHWRAIWVITILALALLILLLFIL